MSRKLRRRSLGALLLSLAMASAAFAAVGCGAAPKGNRDARSANPNIVKVAGTTEDPALVEAADERAAQRVWCEYLEALYQRATGDKERWPSRDECIEAKTMASPEMLRRTASCSRAALDKFDGDPFTSAYAAEVSRCGSSALDAVVVKVEEITPYVTAICGRMARCGEATYDECRGELGNGLAPHLERAVGAMNRRGRMAFEVCLKNLSCGDVGSQVVSCLEPIMDGLLWLPG
ncbi:hypothetical protein QHF83_24955 [Polyangium sp. 15x6]|nr:hypothetical protein [Polyangium sp. 15x6]